MEADGSIVWRPIAVLDNSTCPEGSIEFERKLLLGHLGLTQDEKLVHRYALRSSGPDPNSGWYLSYLFRTLL